ncbi:MAG: arsenite methyltransferase [Chromatiales bacterium]|nr:arsenite methyltransferase [Chromatiales bacterium]
MNQLENDNIRTAVREQYGRVAASSSAGCGCAATSCCDASGSDPNAISMELGYSNADVSDVPAGANMGLGCGNPKAIAALQPGETVLDLGSGGGFDCFLAAREVGATGRVIGVDMTPEMISKARKNADKSNYTHVEFRLGEIENLPVADAVVDVIISNCVINLSPEKAKIFQESFRVLKPGGRIAISDVVATVELTDKQKGDMALFTGCMSGASMITDLENMLKDAGFDEIEIKPKDESRAFMRNWVRGSKMEDYVVAATIEAIKPVV